MATKGPIPLTQDIVQELLEYNPHTGELFWKMRSPSRFSSKRICNSWNATHAGKKASSSASRNRSQISIFGRNYNTHRIAWLWMTGEWNADFDIDHINGDPSDNRFANLRRATASQNAANLNFLPKNNTSGALGVSFDRRPAALRKRWLAQIKVGGKYKFIGRYETREEAHGAYMQFKKEAFKEYANSPRPTLITPNIKVRGDENGSS